MGMTERDRKVLIGIIAFVVLAASWFLLIAPKRQAVSDAEAAKTAAQAKLAEAEQAETAVKQIKLAKPADYAKLIRLGAAIPVDDDFASLLVQLNDVADDAGVDFTNLSASSIATPAADGSAGSTSCQSGASSATGATAAPAAPATPATGGTGSTAQTWVGQDKEKAEQAAAEANARNAAAMAEACSTAPTLADLSAKAAGLQAYQYALTFKGSFYKLDTLFGDLLGLVHKKNRSVAVDGRLLDISSFTMSVNQFPSLSANVQLTGYSNPTLLTSGSNSGGTAVAPAGTPAANTTGN
ncbi:MAG: hypothetical protein QM648_11175 [Solirubrobacterales bacterium]